MTGTPLDWVMVAACGLAVGSFLNVCIWRLPALVLDRGEVVDESAHGPSGFFAWLRDVSVDVVLALRRLSSPPSSCPSCRTPIAWYHNIPVVSWVLLRGRCASCHHAIAVRYPIVEALTGALFVLHLAVLGPGPILWVRLFLAAALIVLFAIDLDHQLLPDVITVPGTLVGLAASAFLPPGPLEAVLGLIVGGGLLWAVSELYLRWRGIEGLGFGDEKMLAMVGAFLGWKATILTLLFGSVSGALLGVGLIASGRGTMGLKLPFGTFLAVGAIAASLWGDALISWYLGLFTLPM